MNLVLESERLVLRPLAAGDADLMTELLTDPAIVEYIGGRLHTAEEVVEEMPTVTRRGGGGCVGIWCAVERATRDKIGYAVLLPLPIEQSDTDWKLVIEGALPDVEIEIGYVLRRFAWGKGFATEVCRRLLRFAFEETPLEQVVAVTHPENLTSQNVLRKCGLAAEGMRRAYASDCPGFRITRRQWHEQTASRS